MSATSTQIPPATPNNEMQYHNIILGLPIATTYLSFNWSVKSTARPHHSSDD
jgi:hypothetical protein